MPEFRRTGDPKAIEAQFDGRCPACEERIDEGDMIVFDEDEDGWVHEECA